MYIDLKHALTISTGPKDIQRSPLIRSVCEEATLKLKSYKVQNDEFDVDQLADINVLIFTKRSITQKEYDNIIACANISSLHVFGRNQDALLHRMIPEAEQYIKWVSICEFCNADGFYDYEGTITCRACRQNLLAKEKQKQKQKEVARPSFKTNRAKKRKLSFNSSSSSVEIIGADNDQETLPSMTEINNSSSSDKVIKIDILIYRVRLIPFI